MLHAQEEKKKKEVEEKQQALEAAKTQVLDCPMCGKGLRTVTVSELHQMSLYIEK